MPKDPRKNAYHLCSLLGNSTEDNQEVFSFLKTVDVQELIEAQGKILTDQVKILYFISFNLNVILFLLIQDQQIRKLP